MPTHSEPLEPRCLFAAAPAAPFADLRVDANRDGALTAADDANEAAWTSGKAGRGAVVLPNLDKDNTAAGGAPDNWAGGAWNGRPVAPNNVIDNAADLLDVGKLSLRKLGPIDNAYDYRVTVQVLRPAADPAWFKSTPATDRVRLFFPTNALATGDVVARPGDAAVVGPGLGDTIRFVANPAAANEYDIADLAGAGWFQFGVEGIKAGAQVKVRVTVEYDPIIVSIRPPTTVTTGTSGSAGAAAPADAAPAYPSVDEVAVRVAPFVLSDNRQAAAKVYVENMNRYGLDNADARAALKRAFGTKAVETRTGDLWQQDGYEIGYAKSPYGGMPVVLELPRARDHFFDQTASMRSFVHGTLLAPGVGVSTDLAALPNDTASAFGGDIESLPIPGRPAGAPGYLLASGMPAAMKDFFAAQGTNPLLDLKLDDWLGVAHTDELFHLAPATTGGTKVLAADPDAAWALLLWAAKLDPAARMHAGMNSNDQLPGATAAGVTVASVLANAKLRKQNLEFAQSSTRLRGAVDAVKSALKLTDEVTAPAAAAANAGAAKLTRGGAFAALLGPAKRTYEVKFLDADRYQLRYRDGAAGAYSAWFDGRRSRDEVFPEAKAYLLKTYWAGGAAKAGDRFAFATNPAATLVRMPVLFATFGLFFEDPAFPSDPAGWRLAAFSTNHVNSVAGGTTAVTGNAYGPRVKWAGGTAAATDLLQAYADAAFRRVGYATVVHADSRLYHDAGGNLHCGTNAVRGVPAGKWWEA
ncbi:MAG: protein-arginine deiminase type-2 [Phycisphaerales bacterium]|nr:protein-arginine deiminase type-2 [Phycisphaerales bacterium]